MASRACQLLGLSGLQVVGCCRWFVRRYQVVGLVRLAGYQASGGKEKGEKREGKERDTQSSEEERGAGTILPP